MRTWLARRLRLLADRLDYAGAPRRTHVFREDGRGCPVWYYGYKDYMRAHDEADTDWNA